VQDNNNNNNSLVPIVLCSGDDRESSFLFQRVSVIVQRSNSVLLHDSLCVEDQPD